MGEQIKVGIRDTAGVVIVNKQTGKTTHINTGKPVPVKQDCKR